MHMAFTYAQLWRPACHIRMPKLWRSGIITGRREGGDFCTEIFRDFSAGEKSAQVIFHTHPNITWGKSHSWAPSNPIFHNTGPLACTSFHGLAGGLVGNGCDLAEA